MKNAKRTGYRVDLLLNPPISKFIEYTHLKTPVTLEMAHALARGLKRQNAAGRIVQVPSGQVIEEWGAA